MKIKVVIGLFVFLSVAAGLFAGHHDWLDARVIEQGHTSASNGQSVPTVTVEVLDPENSNPLARRQVWVITTQAYLHKRDVDMNVGAKLKVYRTGETSQIYGFLVVQYFDKKGKEKSEMHQIVNALASNYRQ